MYKSFTSLGPFAPAIPGSISEGPRCGPTWVPARGEITGLYSLLIKPFPDLLAASLEARDVILVPGEDEGYTNPENWGRCGGPWSPPSRPPRAGPGAWAPPPNPLPSSVPQRGTWPWGWGGTCRCVRPAHPSSWGAALWSASQPPSAKEGVQAPDPEFGWEAPLLVSHTRV